MLFKQLSKILPFKNRIETDIKKLEDDRGQLLQIIEAEINESIKKRVNSPSEINYILTHYTSELKELKQNLFQKYIAQIDLQLLKLRNIQRAAN